MSLHHDLLEQAEHRARRDRGRPKQASLRRAVSTAYYALFHLLVDEATRVMVSDPKLRFQAWKKVRNQPIAKVYLASLLFWKRRRD